MLGPVRTVASRELPVQQVGLERVGGGRRPARGGEPLLDAPGALAQPGRLVHLGAQPVGA
jgi:hypothetical protein